MSTDEKKVNGKAAEGKKKRQRSPGYPAITIDEAITRIRQVYQQDKRAYTTYNAILEHMGYKVNDKLGRSGTSGRVVAALRQYGLLDENDGQFRVSDIGFRIINLPDDSEERTELIRQAALRPQIFRKILAHYQGEVPSDTALRSHLVLNEGFNPDSVDQFIRVFRRTISIANPSAADYNAGEESEAADELPFTGATPMQQPPASSHGQGRVAQATPAQSTPPAGHIPPPADGFQFQISERSVNVLFNGVVTQEAIKKLIKYLEISVDDFPSKKELERAASRAEVDQALEETERELNEGAE